MKKSIALIAGISLCLIASPFRLTAEDAPATATPTPSPGITPGKHHHEHRDINEWLDKHPEQKQKILAQFDTNHNGKLDGDEIKAFKEWRKEHRGEFRHNRKKGGTQVPSATPTTSGTTTPAN